jgi:hypothetical protein
MTTKRTVPVLLRPQLLESRDCSSATLANGVLHVDPGHRFDGRDYAATVARVGREILVSEESVGVGPGLPGVITRFPAARVRRLEIAGSRSHANYLTNATSLPAVMIGGSGADVFNTWSVRNTIITGAGNDVVFATHGGRLTVSNESGQDAVYVHKGTRVLSVGDLRFVYV